MYVHVCTDKTFPGMNCVALPVNWIHPAPSRFRGPPGNPTPPQDPHSIGSSTRSTLCQSAGMPLAHRGHGVYRTRSHGVSEVSRCVRGLTSLFSCLVHTSLHLALREHSQIHTNRRHATSELCSAATDLSYGYALSFLVVFPVFEAGTDLSISLCPRLEN